MDCYVLAFRLFQIIVLFVARGMSSAFFQAVYVYTPEAYPTNLRAVALGSGSASARIGAMITPYVAQVLLRQSLSATVGVYAGIGMFLISEYSDTLINTAKALHKCHTKHLNVESIPFIEIWLLFLKCKIIFFFLQLKVYFINCFLYQVSSQHSCPGFCLLRQPEFLFLTQVKNIQQFQILFLFHFWILKT